MRRAAARGHAKVSGNCKADFFDGMGKNTESIEAFCCGPTKAGKVSGNDVAKAMHDNDINIETRSGPLFQGPPDTLGYDAIWTPGPGGNQIKVAGTSITMLTLDDSSDVQQRNTFFHENIHKLRGMWSQQPFHQFSFEAAVYAIMQSTEGGRRTHMSSMLRRQLTYVERVTKVSTALVFLFFTCQLTGCKKDELDAQRLTWGDSLIDVMTVMNAYQLSLETMPDAVSDKPESDEICDPAGSAESHADVIKALDKLAADAPAQGFSKEVVEKLEHIKSEWQLLRTRQEEKMVKLS